MRPRASGISRSSQPAAVHRPTRLGSTFSHAARNSRRRSRSSRTNSGVSVTASAFSRATMSSQIPLVAVICWRRVGGDCGELGVLRLL